MTSVVKGDTVLIRKGNERGKTGIVQKVLKDDGKIIVKGLNMAKRHLKPSQNQPQSGIVEKELPIRISNTALICGSCGKTTKAVKKVSKEGKIRVCKKCKESL